VASKLTPKEQRFVDAYLGKANGVATKAARQAGYRQTEGALAVTGSRLLRKAKVRAAIQARQAKETKTSILTADERDQALSDIVRNKFADDKVRIRAIAELNKCNGRHSMTHNVKGKLTLEEALAGSRRV